MTATVEVQHLTKRFRDVTAVDDVSFTLRDGVIHGLLGRNGAGKTTLMQLLTGQEFATRGDMSIMGASPVENAGVLRNVCFIKESQRYPEDWKVKHVLKSAPWFFTNWSQDFADSLVEDFELPLERKVKKLSRGQLSAVGVIVGLASRAPLTFFDEPYLGLDAVARHTFYDRLLADYAEHPRTVVLSTHLIDEVANLLERVLVIDHGRILIDDDAETLRSSAVTLVGQQGAVDDFARGREVMGRETIGGIASVTVAGLSEAERTQATTAGLELSPVSLQQLIVRRTGPLDTPTTDGQIKETTA